MCAPPRRRGDRVDSTVMILQRNAHHKIVFMRAVSRACRAVRGVKKSDRSHEVSEYDRAAHSTQNGRFGAVAVLRTPQRPRRRVDFAQRPKAGKGHTGTFAMPAEIAISARMRVSSATRGAGTRSSTTRTRWTQPEHATPAWLRGLVARRARPPKASTYQAAQLRTVSGVESERCRPVRIGNVANAEQRV